MGRKSSPSLASVLAFNTLVPFLFLHITIFVALAVGEVPLQQLPIWTQIDVCAQSCALSASSYFSSSLQCPGKDPDSCLCTLGPTTRLAGLAHVCASNSCTLYPSYSADPERARGALTTYCVVNAAQRADAGTSSNPSISTSETLPSQTASQSQMLDSQKTSYPTGTSTSATITSTSATISRTTTTPPAASLIVVTTNSPSASLTDSNSVSSTATSAPSQSSTAPDSGLSRSDRIAIGIGVPAAFFALVGICLMWKQRKGPFASQQMGVQHIRLDDRE